MNTYHTILFDFDGTIAHADDGLHATVNDTLAHFGFPPMSVEKAREMTGRSFVEFYKSVGTDEAQAIQMREYSLQVQFKYLHLYTLFPGVIHTLLALKESDRPLGVVTTANKPKITRLLADLQLSDFFSTVITIEDVTHKKPDPEPFLKAISSLRGDIGSTLMVGDSEPDIRGAANTGIHSVGVTYSSIGQSIRELSPTYTIDRFDELLDIIKP